MATVSLSPQAQFGQLYTAITSLPGSLWQPADALFEQIHVQKRDEEGNIKLWDVLDFETAKWETADTFSFIEDKETKGWFSDEPRSVLTIKFLGIAFVLAPVYAVGQIGWHVCKTPIQITRLALITLRNTGHLVASCRLKEAAGEMQRGFVLIASTSVQGLFEIVKAPFFFLGVELTALCGIFKPYHARKYEAIVEKAWQCGLSHKRDIRQIPPEEDFSTDCFTCFRECWGRTFYLAYCFQPHFNSTDPHFTVVGRYPLSQSVSPLVSSKVATARTSS